MDLNQTGVLQPQQNDHTYSCFVSSAQKTVITHLQDYQLPQKQAYNSKRLLYFYLQEDYDRLGLLTGVPCKTA